LANKFVRVRLAEIEKSDLNVFEFDYDVTFMIFFLGADQQVYGRYGGRDAKSDSGRMSIAGLKYAMQAALKSHEESQKLAQQKAPVEQEKALMVRDLASSRRYRGCIHCHQVREILNAELKREGKWSRNDIFRYPLPDNLGLVLDIDQGDLIKEIVEGSEASKAGLQVGDVVEKIAGLNVHSLGDAQFALDGAPKTGGVSIQVQRKGKSIAAKIQLHEGWRKASFGWRPSMRSHTHYLPLLGKDLTVDEKKKLGLAADQLAFRQRDPAAQRVLDAGIRPGDIIVGLDDRKMTNMTAIQFRLFVQGNYLTGDKVVIQMIREGKKMDIPMHLKD
jgi:serine protease Do